jgi:two-component system nitrogen regulation sensor histidine kinase GlnL
VNTLPACALYTQDETLLQRVRGFLRAFAEVRHAPDITHLQSFLDAQYPAVVFMDLYVAGCRDLIPRLRKRWPAALVVVLGNPNTVPAREARAAGVYAVLDPSARGTEMQALVTRALQQVELMHENARLRDVASTPTPESTAPATAAAHDISTLTHAARCSDNLDHLARAVVEGFAKAADCLRVGLFLQRREDGPYTFITGLHCSRDVRSTPVDEAHPLPGFLNKEARLLTPEAIDKAKRGTRTLLRQVLEEYGAEIVLPLFGRDRLLGWIFASGPYAAPAYADEDLRNLMAFAGHAAVLLDNAIQFEASATRGEHLETLLDSMATGIVMTNPSGTITWINRAAAQMFELEPAEATGQPARLIGSQPSSMLLQALDSQSGEHHLEWSVRSSGKTFTMHVRLLHVERDCVGAVALIRDVTEARAMPEAPSAEIDDQTFWSELAAGMSHEIRNPLVAIRTFAQLLPDRYEDPAFRAEFSALVTSEVDKLNRVVEQINAFATPPELVFTPLDIRSTIKKGLNMALLSQPRNGVKVEIAMDDRLPFVEGDDEALARCFTHIVVNAMEAVSRSEKPQIRLAAREEHDAEQGRQVHVTVADNGAGIDEEIYPRIFSPFCTTKARGLGLGLPIVHRTIGQHRGKLDIATGKEGTRVTVTLPAKQ